MSTFSMMPDPDFLYELYRPDYKVQLLRIALSLHIFTALAQEAATAEQLAQICQITPQGARALLDYLTGLQLLQKRQSTYHLSSTAATFLVEGKDSYTGDLILAETDPHFWKSIQHSIQTGQPVAASIPWEQDAWLESYRGWRPAQSIQMWKAAGITPGGFAHLRVLDLACGCAIKSFVLAQADSTVEVTCIDTEKVLESARNLAQRLNILPQVHFTPGSILEIKAEQSYYHAALLGQITHHLTAEQNQYILTFLHNALQPGGRLVIDVPQANQDNHNPPSEAISLLNITFGALHQSQVYSFVQYKEWLQQKGFTAIQQLSENWIVAFKPEVEKGSTSGVVV